MLKTILNEFAENSYILSEDEVTYVIDPGSNTASMLSYLEKHALHPQAILLTHGHFDHIQGVNELMERYRIPVFIHPDERDFLFDPNLNLSTLMREPYRVFQKELVKVYHENQTFPLGTQEIRVLHTPGHTRGSVSFALDSMLFSGDALFKETIGRTDLPTGDHRTLIETVHRLIESFPENTLVYPGHGPMTTIVHEKHHNPYVKE